MEHTPNPESIPAESHAAESEGPAGGQHEEESKILQSENETETKHLDELRSDILKTRESRGETEKKKSSANDPAHFPEKPNENKPSDGFLSKTGKVMKSGFKFFGGFLLAAFGAAFAGAGFLLEKSLKSKGKGDGGHAPAPAKAAHAPAGGGHKKESHGGGHH